MLQLRKVELYCRNEQMAQVFSHNLQLGIVFCQKIEAKRDGERLEFVMPVEDERYDIAGLKALPYVNPDRPIRLSDPRSKS